jgi:hypothetical protein
MGKGGRGSWRIWQGSEVVSIGESRRVAGFGTAVFYPDRVYEQSLNEIWEEGFLAEALGKI